MDIGPQNTNISFQNMGLPKAHWNRFFQFSEKPSFGISTTYFPPKTNMTMENSTMNESMYFLLKMWIFQCDVGFTRGVFLPVQKLRV